jgi:hypothetical protein
MSDVRQVAWRRRFPSGFDRLIRSHTCTLAALESTVAVIVSVTSGYECPRMVLLPSKLEPVKGNLEALGGLVLESPRPAAAEERQHFEPRVSTRSWSRETFPIYDGGKEGR